MPYKWECRDLGTDGLRIEMLLLPEQTTWQSFIALRDWVLRHAPCDLPPLPVRTPREGDRYRQEGPPGTVCRVTEERTGPQYCLLTDDQGEQMELWRTARELAFGGWELLGGAEQPVCERCLGEGEVDDCAVPDEAEYEANMVPCSDCDGTGIELGSNPRKWCKACEGNSKQPAPAESKPFSAIRAGLTYDNTIDADTSKLVALVPPKQLAPCPELVDDPADNLDRHFPMSAPAESPMADTLLRAKAEIKLRELREAAKRVADCYFGRNFLWDTGELQMTIERLRVALEVPDAPE